MEVLMINNILRKIKNKLTKTIKIRMNIPQYPGIDFTPTFKTNGSACADIRAYIVDENNNGSSMTIEYEEVVKIPTKLRFEIPEGYEIQVRPRSSLSDKGIVVMIGTIDSDYRGEVYVQLINLSKDKSSFTIQHGYRIAQIKVSKVENVIFCHHDGELSKTKRGEGGFGHTGIE